MHNLPIVRQPQITCVVKNLQRNKREKITIQSSNKAVDFGKPQRLNRSHPHCSHSLYSVLQKLVIKRGRICRQSLLVFKDTCALTNSRQQISFSPSLRHICFIRRSMDEEEASWIGVASHRSWRKLRAYLKPDRSSLLSSLKTPRSVFF